MAQSTSLQVSVTTCDTHTRIGFWCRNPYPGRPSRTIYVQLETPQCDDETVETIAVWISDRLEEARQVQAPMLW